MRAATPAYTLSFHETGLPNGTKWQANYNGSWASSTTSTISFSATNGSFECGIVGPISQAYLTYTPAVWVNLTGTSQTVNVSFQKSYLAWFNGTGLPSGDGISIRITAGPLWVGVGFGGSSPDVAYAMLNGTYNFTASCYCGTTYLANPPNGSYTINGGPTSTTIPFVRNTTGSLWFAETGLAANTTWGVNLTNSTGSTWRLGNGAPGFGQPVDWITGLVPQGSYSYSVAVPSGYSASPSTGYVSVSGGQTVQTCIEFTNASNPLGQSCNGYLVTFNASGLPSSDPFCANVTYNQSETYWACQGAGTSEHTTTVGAFYDGRHTFTIPSEGGYTAEPSNGTVLIDNANVYVNVQFVLGPTYPINVSETGLANGTLWAVDFSGTLYYSAGSQLSAGSWGNGSYSYSIPAVPGYAVNRSSGQVLVFGKAVHLFVQFTAVPPTLYPVQFDESGLPAGTNWSVSLGGSSASSTASSLRFTEANGSYAYAIGPVTGFNASPAAGTVVVVGTGARVLVNFTSNVPPTYPLMFVEAGLPQGSGWSVAVGGYRQSTNNSSMSFTLVGGTYTYQARAISSHNCSCEGNVTVEGPTTVPLTFFPDSYRLTFQETGLPNGTGWGVLLGTRSNGSLSASIGFTVANGTYSYDVLPPSGYYASPGSGVATVQGANRTVALVFHLVLYPVVFIELGLPNGTAWGVRIVNASLGVNETLNSTGNAITAFLPNGTFSITLLLPANYTASSTSSTITVAGTALSETPVRVVPVPAATVVSPPTPAESLFPWLVVAVVGLIGALAVAGAFLLRRRRPPE